MDRQGLLGAIGTAIASTGDAVNLWVSIVAGLCTIIYMSICIRRKF